MSRFVTTTEFTPEGERYQLESVYLPDVELGYKVVNAIQREHSFPLDEIGARYNEALCIRIGAAL